MSYKEVATWNGSWGTTSFSTREEFRDFVLPLFKEPGQYQFDKTSFLFNEQARYYTQHKTFCHHPFGTRDYIKYWDDQKDKCRNGVIFKSGDHTWYLTRDYYMWINFLPIYDKVKKHYGFPDIWDAQYHTALYELLAELHYKHAVKLKKRQFGSSYFHMGKLINQLWFEEGVTMKIGASSKDYINDKGSWKFLEEYRSFLNEHTAWYRPMTPGKVLMWQQQIPVRKGNRVSMKGNKGVIQGVTFDKDPTTGVGGGIRYFFYEEAGIAPTMHTTTEYLFPAMKSGHIYTGMFIAAGSVGDLADCEPLKKFMLYPEINDIYAVPSNLLDEKGTTGTTGLFIPEQWSMPPYIDEFGNSLVQQALEAIELERLDWKKTLSAETYQLRVSQAPTNIAEAFAFRKEAIYPLHLIAAQEKRILDKQYPCEYLDLHRDPTGKITASNSFKLPISEFPISSNKVDKEGVIIIWERPPAEPEWGSYYGTIDPVGEGKTTTSDSLCSIYIQKNPVQVTHITSGESKTYIERDKIVASWCGRFDDITKTHERLELLIEWYNAWTVVENNVSLFIQHMINKKKQRYLVPKDMLLFLKDLQANQTVYQQYGWKNTGNIFPQHLTSYAIEYCKEELDHELKTDGTIVRTTYGIERIPDVMLLKEMRAYQLKLNVDRLVSFAALAAFSKVQESNRGLKKRIIDEDSNLQKSKKNSIFNKSMFHNIGNTSTATMKRPNRNPFHNLK